MSDPVRVTLGFTYDAYEAQFGDGFYPLLAQRNDQADVDIRFVLSADGSRWTQEADDDVAAINGLDGDEGARVLTALNTQGTAAATSVWSARGICLWTTRAH